MQCALGSGPTGSQCSVDRVKVTLGYSNYNIQKRIENMDVDGG